MKFLLTFEWSLRLVLGPFRVVKMHQQLTISPGISIISAGTISP